MISKSTIIAVNVLESKNALSRHFYLKKRAKAHYKKLIKEQQKISPLMHPQISKLTANQAFHDASNKIVPDSQLQNKIATLELQVFKAKKAALQQKQLKNLIIANLILPVKRSVINLGEVRNLNFRLFYKHKGVKNLILFLLYASIN